MQKLKVAIIGQGRSGRDIHGRFFHTEENAFCDVVAVVELDAQRRERAEREYPGCTVYSDYRELFARDDLIVHSEHFDFSGTAFDAATRDFYEMVYNKLTKGKDMSVTPEMAAMVVNVIETVRGQNPLPVKF